MSALDDVISGAMACYRELLLAYQELDDSGSVADGKVYERLQGRLEEKMAAAHVADQNLVNALADTDLSGRQMTLLHEYREILVKVAERNRMLLDRTRTNRALVLAELSEIRAGKTALAGYRLQSVARADALSETY